MEGRLVQKTRCPDAEGSIRPSTSGQCSELAGPEFDSFARVEDAGCLENWWGNLSTDKRTGVAHEGDQTGRSRRQV
jgi:hypothetical protein